MEVVIDLVVWSFFVVRFGFMVIVVNVFLLRVKWVVLVIIELLMLLEKVMM